MDIKKDDWVVERGTYGYEIHEVAHVSDSLAYYKKYGNREGRIRKADIVFSGDARSAKNLHEKLRSSRALMDDERIKATERRNKRDDDLIAAANSGGC